MAIIREQQEWADRFFAGRGAPGKTPKYLFLAGQMNRNGDRPYPGGTLHARLSELARRLDVRDAAGALVDFNRTHRFRHTVATNLLNSGVPIHVLQRYMGHLTPAMTMHYAQTLQSTAEAEFLRYRKLTADARDTGIDPTDLYDLLQLGQRTDRMLPNGYCLLPPRQVCGKGNACLTCDKFATDASFLPELNDQLQRTGQLIETRQAAFTARTGAPMSQDNVWLAGRRTEQNALRTIITELENEPGAAPGPNGGPRRRDHRPHRSGRRREGDPMTQQRPGNIANLKAAAARRHQAAVTRAEAGLQKLTRSGQQITFRGVAKAAGVSLEFLYNHPQLRSRIEHLRAQQQTTAAPARPAADPGAASQASSVIRTLTAELTASKARHRAEVEQLRQALAAAHGENLLLRRRLGHPDQASPAGTTQPLTSCRTGKPPDIRHPLAAPSRTRPRWV